MQCFVRIIEFLKHHLTKRDEIAASWVNPASIHFTITKRLKRKLSREDFESIKEKVKHFNIPVTIDNIGLYYCKDAEHRYYREISKCDFPAPAQY